MRRNCCSAGSRGKKCVVRRSIGSKGRHFTGAGGASSLARLGAWFFPESDEVIGEIAAAGCRNQPGEKSENRLPGSRCPDPLHVSRIECRFKIVFSLNPNKPGLDPCRYAKGAILGPASTPAARVVPVILLRSNPRLLPPSAEHGSNSWGLNRLVRSLAPLDRCRHCSRPRS